MRGTRNFHRQHGEKNRLVRSGRVAGASAAAQVTKTEPRQVSARKRVIYPHRFGHGSPTHSAT